MLDAPIRKKFEEGAMTERSEHVSRNTRAVIPVLTGDVWVTSQKVILRSDGIGSCVVVAAYDPKRSVGGLAHIMLPGRSAERMLTFNKKYAHDAIADLIFKMMRLGVGKGDIEACLIGGGNVLQEANDTLCEAIIKSVTYILEAEGVRILKQAVGGTFRRSAWLRIEDGALYYTQGDQIENLLYQWGAHS